ncbi:MAG: EscE/YscE/SsaE family type III secretion system needle protein co-chaperone [Gammaproteobacteria bacterium]
MAEQSEQELVLDVEEQLRKDAKGEYKNKLKAQLKEHIQAVDKRLSSGAAPDEYKQLQTIKDALEAATKVTDEMWKLMHPKSR